MRLSVFTPSHDSRFLFDCYRSLLAQSVSDWEWVIVLNRGARDWRPPQADDRVRISRVRSREGVGAARHAACEIATGDILVELDHDDLLTPTCLAEVHEAFVADPSAALVYSDFAHVNSDLTRNESRFNAAMGWQYTDEVIGGMTYLRCHALEASPHNVGYIWYAPNHVRAMRRTAYDAVGGYDTQLAVLDDHELMIRLYMHGDFRHVARCLYLQRFHRANTQSEPATNRFIQDQTVRYYQENIEALAAAWARRRGLAVLTTRPASTDAADAGLDPEIGQVVDFHPTRPRFALGEGTVGLITATDVLQHVPDRAAFFNECYRVLAHGGLIVTRTPSTDGRGAFQDPSYVAFYNENSFWYLTERARRASIPALSARLQMSHVRTYFPTPWHEEHHMPYAQANLLAVKDGPRQGGLLLA